MTPVTFAVVDQGAARPQLLGQELAAAVAAQDQNPFPPDLVERGQGQQPFAARILGNLGLNPALLPAGRRCGADCQSGHLRPGEPVRGQPGGGLFHRMAADGDQQVVAGQGGSQLRQLAAGVDLQQRRDNCLVAGLPQPFGQGAGLGLGAQDQHRHEP